VSVSELRARGAAGGLFDAAHRRELQAMVDDRKLTEHTCNEPLAEEIASFQAFDSVPRCVVSSLSWG
jgi:hypothetical protein